MIKKVKGPIYHDSVFQENLDERHPYPDFNKANFSWIAPEYIQHPKSTRWWVIAAILLLISTVIEAIVSNWTMLAATLIFGLVYWFTHEFHPPKHTKINISTLGIKVGHQEISFSEIEHFWIIYNPPAVKQLAFRLKDSFFPTLILQLEKQNPEAIRAFLEQYLPEVTDAKEGFTDAILRALKL